MRRVEAPVVRLAFVEDVPTPTSPVCVGSAITVTANPFGTACAGHCSGVPAAVTVFRAEDHAARFATADVDPPPPRPPAIAAAFPAAPMSITRNTSVPELVVRTHQVPRASR